MNKVIVNVTAFVVEINLHTRLSWASDGMMGLASKVMYYSLNMGIIHNFTRSRISGFL